MPEQEPTVRETVETPADQGKQSEHTGSVQKNRQRRKHQAASVSDAEDGADHAHTRSVSLRAGLAVIGGQTAGALSRRLHLGGGTSIVGVVAQRVYPNIVKHLTSQLEHGSILVTGTNGKTTTSGFLAAILDAAGLRVWRNREGSNLMGGVASSLVAHALPNGHLRKAEDTISIFEGDEAVVPQILETAHPRIAVFTNLFRDQLDRYGEVDSVASRWQQALSTLSPDTILVLNADDPAIAHLGESFSGKKLYFGIDDADLAVAQQDTDERYQVMDTRTCPNCGSEYSYEMRFFSHMGHYTCANCGLKRPQADVRATRVQSSDFDRLHVRVATDRGEQELTIPLPGLYNIYNALAAITAALALDVNWEPIVAGIEHFQPIFGRGEQIEIEGRNVRLLLAKNPTGFNEVLRTLFSEGISRHIFFILNDNTADGRDVSWIWDVDFERVPGLTNTLVVSGVRALDLAVRLKYAGVDQEDITIAPFRPLRTLKHESERNDRNRRGTKNSSRSNTNSTNGTETIGPETGPKITRHYGLAEALNTAVRQTPVGETLFIVPTYTGLLEIHRELEQRGLVSHYWEGTYV